MSELVVIVESVLAELPISQSRHLKELVQRQLSAVSDIKERKRDDRFIY